MDPASITLAMTLVSQGMRLWADFADRAAKGTLNEFDLDVMASQLGTSIELLQADIDAAQAEGR